MTEGISVGYGDDYAPVLEGQYLDVTAVPDGRYVLVHRADEERWLVEARYDNNASSVLLRLAHDGRGARTVRVLARCPQRDTCGAGNP